MAAHSGSSPKALVFNTSNAGGMLQNSVSAFPSPGKDCSEFASASDSLSHKQDESSDLKERRVLQESEQKDEDESAKHNNKTFDKSRPISSTPISGTPW